MEQLYVSVGVEARRNGVSGMTIERSAPSGIPLLSTQNGWRAPGQWRYEYYQRLPNDGQRYEIIEDDIIESYVLPGGK